MTEKGVYHPAESCLQTKGCCYAKYTDSETSSNEAKLKHKIPIPLHYCSNILLLPYAS